MKIRFGEFLTLIAAMMACHALAVDAMLPALPTIAHALGVTDGNRMQWVVGVYITGTGLGQLLWGVLSDRFGRRRILLIGLTLYVIAALLSGYANTFEELLVWRMIHGVAAASLVVSRSVIRDLYEGRQMARVMSLTFIVFMMVPMLAPSLGQLVLALGSWHHLFIVFGVFGAVIGIWVLLRLPETLHPEYRMVLDVRHISRAAIRVFTERASLWYMLSSMLISSTILAYVSTVQQIFETVFQRPTLMPSMFAICAGAMAVAAYTNSRIVGRYGMRRLSQIGLLMMIAVTGAHSLLAGFGHESMVSFLIMQSLTMASLGLTLGNFGAMAMESMGSIAGVAASLQGCVNMMGGGLLGALIGHFFNGTTLPLALGSLLCALATLGCVLIAEKGRLFRPHHAPVPTDSPPVVA